MNTTSLESHRPAGPRSVSHLRQAQSKKESASLPEPAETFEGYASAQAGSGRSPCRFSFRPDPKSNLGLAIQGAGTVFSGIASYAGWITPVADSFAEKGVPERTGSCPQVLAVLDQPLEPGMEICPKEESAYHALNSSLAGKFPTLERALTQPDEFKADLQNRFEAQKKLTPDDPYAFDFSDYAVPVMKQVAKALDKEMGEVQGQVKGLKGRRFSRKKIEARKLGLQYLGDLKSEIADRVERGDFSYRRTQELGYFSACALGYFDMDKIHPRDRMLLPLDSYLQAEDKVDIKEEYRRYKDNEFTVFQKGAHKASGFDKVEDSFANAYFNPEKMELVSLPTMEPLSEEPFMRLLNKDIFLSGIAADPISADGFMRQGRLFWLHDKRHNSAIFAKNKEYQEERNLSPEQIKKLDRRIDVWNSELKAAIDKIEDRQMLNAVETVVFNIHHDRGLPLVPSTYDQNQLRPVTKALRFMWGVSGQNQRFDSPRTKFQEAYDWVNDFFAARRSQESEIVGR